MCVGTSDKPLAFALQQLDGLLWYDDNDFECLIYIISCISIWYILEFLIFDEILIEFTRSCVNKDPKRRTQKEKRMENVIVLRNLGITKSFNSRWRKCRWGT